MGQCNSDSMVQEPVNDQVVQEPGSYITIAMNNKMDELRWLLNNGYNLERPDESGSNMLFWLGYYNQIEMAKELLESGYDPNILDRSGHTAVFWAAYNKNYMMVKLLVKYSTDLTLGESTPLWYTIYHNRIEGAKLLLSWGSIPSNQEIEMAKRMEHDEILDYLLLSPSVKTRYGTIVFIKWIQARNYTYEPTCQLDRVAVMLNQMSYSMIRSVIEFV